MININVKIILPNKSLNDFELDFLKKLKLILEKEEILKINL